MRDHDWKAEVRGSNPQKAKIISLSFSKRLGLVGGVLPTFTLTGKLGTLGVCHPPTLVRQALLCVYHIYRVKVSASSISGT